MDPKLDLQSQSELFSAVRLLVSEDQCEGRFVFGRQVPTFSKKAKKLAESGTLSKDGGGENSKSHLQTLLARAGHGAPTYKTGQMKNNTFRSKVIFNGLDFVGRPRNSKKEAEKDAAAEALRWLTGESESTQRAIDNMSTILKKRKKKQETYATRWR